MSKILDDTNPALAFVSATYETESAEKEVLDIDDKPHINLVDTIGS